MTTTVIFKIDKKLKEAAQKKAKKEGITLTNLYTNVTRSYIEGTISVGLTFPTVTPNAKTARGLRQSRKDYLAGKNMSPRFKTGAEMDKYLASL